ncbi:MAG: AraC family transcriptional regulator [Eubacterium sp.]|nr:AraC family transcriptional regulator [Eubacterium sp.]
MLTQTAIPINRIAEMLCFSSPYHFSTEFKKMYSLPPSIIRKSK